MKDNRSEQILLRRSWWKHAQPSSVKTWHSGLQLSSGGLFFLIIRKRLAFQNNYNKTTLILIYFSYPRLSILKVTTMTPNRTRKWWEALWFVPTDWWITILKANFLSFYKMKLSNPLTFLYILRTMKIHNTDSKRLRDFHFLNTVKYLHESGLCLPDLLQGNWTLEKYSQFTMIHIWVYLKINNSFKLSGIFRHPDSSKFLG